MKQDIMEYRKKDQYLSVAKWRRRNDVIYLKNKIYIQQQQFHDNRLFFTYDLIRTKDGEDVKLSWIDLQFPSKKYNDIVYCAFLSTAQYRMSEHVHWSTWDKIWTETENLTPDKFWTEPDPDNKFKQKKDKLYISKSDEVKLPIYENRTRYEEQSKRVKEWYEENKNKYEIKEYFLLHELDSSEELHIYDLFDPLKNKNFNKSHLSHWYVLISAVIDAPVLTVDNINNLIQKFYNNDEKGWINNNPIPQDHLIYNNEWVKQLQTSLANPLIILKTEVLK